MANELPDPEKIRLDAERDRLEFLNTDLDLSFTFLDVVSTFSAASRSSQASAGMAAKSDDATSTAAPSAGNSNARSDDRGSKPPAEGGPAGHGGERVQW
jgi:hypothetical protein